MVFCRYFRISSAHRSEARSTAYVALGIIGFIVLGTLTFWIWQNWRIRDLGKVIVPFTIAVWVAYTKFALTKRADDYTIAVDDHGIETCHPKQYLGYMSWQEIIATYNDPILRHLTLRSSNPSQPIRLRYQLEQFPELLQMLQEHTPWLNPVKSLPYNFHRKWPSVMVLVFWIAVGISVFNLLLGNWFYIEITALALMLFSVLWWTYWLNEHHRIRRVIINQSSIQIDQGRKQIDLSCRDIDTIHLTSTSKRLSLIHPLEVLVTMRDGRQWACCPFGCDAFIVYRVLKSSFASDT